MKKPDLIGWRTATAISIANMIGTGVFTSLGYQLVGTINSWSIIILWTIGAVMALCGALSYAELGTHLQRSGGEYHFLTKTYHPLIGYLSGWVSITVGFPAPVALSAMAIGKYTCSYFGVSGTIISLIVVVLVTVFHSISISYSSRFQNITTLLKIVLIIILILCGLIVTPKESALIFSSTWKNEIILPAFAVSFVFVTFSYSGWNAASYIVDEIKDVQKNLPKSLILGSLLVGLLYILLNIVFLRQNSLDAIKGTLEIGQITAISMFGNQGGKIISLGIALMLVSNISAMIWAGSRITQVMAEDYQLWKWFSVKTKRSIPSRSIWLQTGITIFLTLTGTFEQLLIYSGFILQIFGVLAVGAVFILRKKKTTKNRFLIPLYPVPQIIFLILSAWVLMYLIIAQPVETSLGMLSLLLGVGTFWWSNWLSKKDKPDIFIRK